MRDQTRISPAVLEVSDLSVTLHRDERPHLVLDRVGLTVHSGEVVAVVGESGSGKSTLGLAVMGLLAADNRPLVSGEISVDGVNYVGKNAERWRQMRHEKLGAVFQDPIGSLNPSLKIGAQLTEAIADGSPPVQWLERVGIAEPNSKLQSYPHQLSGGQCQRVMIAMAIAKRPRLLIADEPTTALDMVVQAQILDLLLRLVREDGIAMVFTTHDLDVATVLADRMVVMHAGRLVEDGPSRLMIARPAHPYTAALVSARFDLEAERARQLPTLASSAQTANSESVGCAFAPRCPLATEMCVAQRPPLDPAAHGGSVACFHADKVRSDLWSATARPWPPAPELKRELLFEMAAVDKAYVLPRRLPIGRGRTLRALSGVDLRIYRGESVAIVGSSGSGKSTLLRVAAGLIAPDSGDVVIEGNEQPQIIFQDAIESFTPWLTIGEQIGERLRPLRFSRAARDEKVATALGQVGLDPKLARTRAPQLSGGQCQRAALARAIVVPPNLLLCDEAISAMDVALAAAMLNLIRALQLRLGMALLFVTHDLAAARFVADRIIVMDQGKIVETGDSEELVRAPKHPATIALLAAVPDRQARAAA